MNDCTLPDRVRQVYWHYANQIRRIKLMMQSERRPFGREVLRSHLLHTFGGVVPIRGRQRRAADAAVDWLLRAQSASPDDGVSHGYFPCHWDMGWRRSYPETTGYIIPSLFEYANRYEAVNVSERAIAMAHWESDVQMENGAVQGGPVCLPEEQKAAVFNTGMVLQGWTAAWRETGDKQFFESGRRAANFLLADMGTDGHFRTHGTYVTQHAIKTYNVLCAWAMYRFGEDSGEVAFQRAAIFNGEATLAQQSDNGWFDNCCLTHPKAPLTHTLGYTLQGILELGVLSDRSDFIAAAERGTIPLMRAIDRIGYLAARFDSNWRGTSRYSCLTGSAQIAIVLYRLFEITGKADYRAAADRLVDYLKALQCLESSDRNIIGAIAGSFPILSEYMTAGYPNWATKYFLDAVMLQEQLA
jgi:hypothetical protein